MAYITSSVEYAIHCLLFLVNNEDKPLSSKDLAELQGVSPSFMAKIFPKLEKAGLVVAQEGVRGGYLLARSAHEISFLDIVNAIEAEKPLLSVKKFAVNVQSLTMPHQIGQPVVCVPYMLSCYKPKKLCETH